MTWKSCFASAVVLSCGDRASSGGGPPMSNRSAPQARIWARVDSKSALSWSPNWQRTYGYAVLQLVSIFTNINTSGPRVPGSELFLPPSRPPPVAARTPPGRHATTELIGSELYLPGRSENCGLRPQRLLLFGSLPHGRRPWWHRTEVTSRMD